MSLREGFFVLALGVFGFFVGAFLLVMAPIVIYGLPIFIVLFVLLQVIPFLAVAGIWHSLKWLWRKMQGQQHGPGIPVVPQEPPPPEAAPGWPLKYKLGFVLGLSAASATALLNDGHTIYLLRDIPWI